MYRIKKSKKLLILQTIIVLGFLIFSEIALGK